jgi:hypothetical protein
MARNFKELQAKMDPPRVSKLALQAEGVASGNSGSVPARTNPRDRGDYTLKQVRSVVLQGVHHHGPRIFTPRQPRGGARDTGEGPRARRRHDILAAMGEIHARAGNHGAARRVLAQFTKTEYVPSTCFGLIPPRPRRQRRGPCAGPDSLRRPRPAAHLRPRPPHMFSMQRKLWPLLAGCRSEQLCQSWRDVVS